ncbi:trigger factor [Lutibaculum baratangense]|uniref:Trigger factor n=1 Tax=Lutibaculum baratangense AMV1 TaxID=631454 RepID=V4RPI3_9HYPH|nr:trigger factor [Lutibaculum baratangense]ESR25105.1 Cell division trigger factor [Lutibaculum baratangense AMV1]
MQVTETVNQGLKRELKIQIPAQELDQRLNTRLNELKGQVRLRGFRPGKVPVNHLRRVYGKSIMAEILEQTVSETSQKALTDRNEKPAYQPKIELPDNQDEIEQVLAGEGDLAFTMEFEVLPPVEVGDLTKIEVEREVSPVEDKDVDETLQRIADQNKGFEARAEGEAAQDGDRVTMDFVGKIDGEAFEGGSAEGATIVLGSGTFIPGFEEQLVGVKAGDEKTVEVTFPEQYQAAHLAGKPATFEIKVTEVAAPVDRTIDDEFATSLGFESLDKLKEAIRDQITKDLEGRSREKLKRQVLDALDEMHSFDLPEQLVEQEFQSIWQQVTADLERSGRSFADEGTTEEEQQGEYRKIAERRVRLGLVLAEIGEKNEVKVADEEVNRALIEQVRRYPGQEQQVWEAYQKNPGMLAQLRAPIFEDKVIDYIVELATVTEKRVSREELFSDPDDEHHHDHDHDHHHDHDHGDHGHDHEHDHGAEAAGEGGDEKPAKKKRAPRAKKAD